MICEVAHTDSGIIALVDEYAEHQRLPRCHVQFFADDIDIAAGLCEEFVFEFRSR